MGGGCIRPATSAGSRSFTRLFGDLLVAAGDLRAVTGYLRADCVWLPFSAGAVVSSIGESVFANRLEEICVLSFRNKEH